jgi:hypothetical protein
MPTASLHGRHRYRFPLPLRWAAILLSSILVVISARSQDATAPSEPESPSVLYYLDASAKLIPLESQLAHRKQKLHGVTGGENMYSLSGQKSPVRVRATDKLNFVVRLKGSLDPVEAIQLFHVDAVDGSRVVPIDNFNALGRVSKVTMPTGIDFNAAIYSSSSFKLIPIHVLVPGEYCFFMRTGNELPKVVPGFCFGVDGP